MSGTFERDKRDKRDKSVSQTTKKSGTNGTNVYIHCPCPGLMSCPGRESFWSELSVLVAVGLVVLLLALLAFPMG